MKLKNVFLLPNLFILILMHPTEKNKNNNMIVFDINGTLLYRLKKNERNKIKSLREMNVFPTVSLSNHYLYFRPKLNVLNRFLDDHELPYILWSTCSRKNLEEIKNSLKNQLRNILGFLSFDECTAGTEKGNIKASRWIKDLKFVQSFWENIFKTKNDYFDVSKITLVDDSVLKSVEGQNLIEIKSFEGEADDLEIICLCNKLHELTSCKVLGCLDNYK